MSYISGLWFWFWFRMKICGKIVFKCVNLSISLRMEPHVCYLVADFTNAMYKCLKSLCSPSETRENILTWLKSCSRLFEHLQQISSVSAFPASCSCRNLCPWSMKIACIPDADISHEPTFFCELLMVLILILEIKPWHAVFWYHPSHED